MQARTKVRSPRGGGSATACSATRGCRPSQFAGSGGQADQRKANGIGGYQFRMISTTLHRLFPLALLLLLPCLLKLTPEASAAPQFSRGGGGFSQFSAYRPHPAVVKNAQQEARLPSILRNPFYQDPRTARALAQHSWLGPGEKPVYTRDSEKIPRREIYNVLVHAGLIPRQRSLERFQSFH